MKKTDAIFDLVNLSVKVAQETSKQYNNGEINNSFALGMSTSGLSYLIDRLNLNKKQIEIITLEFESLERQYNVLKSA
jgi:hypothetical protein